MKKEPIEIIEQQLERLGDERVVGWLTANSWIIPTNRPGVVFLETFDGSLCSPKLAKLKKRIHLTGAIDMLYEDCGSNEAPVKVVESWGRWLKRAGEELLKKAAEAANQPNL
jgi:hypothetical protein